MTVAELSQELSRRAHEAFQCVWRSTSVHPPAPVENRKAMLEQQRRLLSERSGFDAEMIERNLASIAAQMDRWEAGCSSGRLFEGFRRGERLACRSTSETDGEPREGVTTEWFADDRFASSYESPPNPSVWIEVRRFGPREGEISKHRLHSIIPHGAFLSPLFWASPLPEVAELHEGDALIADVRSRELAWTCPEDRPAEIDVRTTIEFHPESLQIRQIRRFPGLGENADEVYDVDYDRGFPCRIVMNVGRFETIYERVSFGVDPDSWLPMPSGVRVDDWRFGPKSGVFYDSIPDFLTDDEVLNTMPSIARAAFKIFQM